MTAKDQNGNINFVNLVKNERSLDATALAQNDRNILWDL